MYQIPDVIECCEVEALLKVLEILGKMGYTWNSGHATCDEYIVNSIKDDCFSNGKNKAYIFNHGEARQYDDYRTRAKKRITYTSEIYNDRQYNMYDAEEFINIYNQLNDNYVPVIVDVEEIASTKALF